MHLKNMRQKQFTHFTGIKVGEKLTEGKTKCVFEIPDATGQVLIQSKDRITAGDGDRAHEMKGKAAISNSTTSAIFELLNNAGKTLHLKDFQMCRDIPFQHSEKRELNR